MSSKLIKLFSVLLTAGICTEAAWRAYKYRKAKIAERRRAAEAEARKGIKHEQQEIALKKRKPPDLWNTVLFFPDPTFEEPSSTYQQLLSYFENAKVSIQLCTYLVSEKSFENLIIQVITDYDTMAEHNWTCRLFRFRGTKASSDTALKNLVALTYFPNILISGL
jgi:adenine-specific DNA glycosylase